MGELLPSDPATLGRLADLLRRQGIDPADIGRVERISTWEGFYKDGDGQARKVDMAGVVLAPSWDTGPEWPVVQPAPPTAVKPRPLKRDRPDHLKVAVILPDSQIGYRQDLDTGELDPFHDESAIDVALQVARAARPDRVVMLGDMLDLPAHSKFTQEPAFARTTQAAVDRAGRFAAEVRVNVGDDCEIDWLEGNHDARLGRSILNNAAASFGLRRANIPDSWPVLSVPNLCRLDEVGVTYHPGYPANEVWLADNFRAIHGLKVRSTTSTAAAVVDDERVNTVFGHVHRAEVMHRTRHTRHGARTTVAVTPGCLCRVDGAVPSTKSGTDLLGRPLVSYENWQQGCAVITYTDDGHIYGVEVVVILGGVALWRGRRFTADVTPLGAAA